jgi:glyoxylase-like metal-dependent hydrolase (beta-lactamase superfamily II)
MTVPTYELFAMRYATRDARRYANFVGGDPHDASMPMDYFVWAARNADRTVVIDTGFTAETAARRKRDYLRTPASALAAVGIDCAAVSDVVITHMHYDHVGGYAAFPKAEFHLQDDEMRFSTGRHMRHSRFNHGYDVDDVEAMIRLTFERRVTFHCGDTDLFPGITLHRMGGHTAGLQCVRVHTARGYVVVASDTAHYYEHFETYRAFTTVFDVGEAIEAFDRLRLLADTPEHIVPGHDPLVMQRYPAARHDLDGVAVRLDVPPARGPSRDASSSPRA